MLAFSERLFNKVMETAWLHFECSTGQWLWLTESHSGSEDCEKVLFAHVECGLAEHLLVF